MKIQSADILARIHAQIFDQRVIQNDYRGIYVEYIVAAALGSGWQHVGFNWGGWDIHDNSAKRRIEVRSSAAKQSWEQEVQSIPQYNIGFRRGYYKGADWYTDEGRQANIYVFAWHPRFDDDCDHRNPAQWTFFVVSADKLPNQKTIRLGPLLRLAKPCSVDDLRVCVETISG